MPDFPAEAVSKAVWPALVHAYGQGFADRILRPRVGDGRVRPGPEGIPEHWFYLLAPSGLETLTVLLDGFEFSCGGTEAIRARIRVGHDPAPPAG